MGRDNTGGGRRVAGTQPAPPSHDRNDLHDPITPTQRQQRTSPSPYLPRRQATVSPSPGQDDRSSISSSRLRRTPRFQATPSPRPSDVQRPIHLEAATVGISPSPRFATAPATPALGNDVRVQPPQTPRRQLSQDLSNDLEASTHSPSFIERIQTRSANRVEKMRSKIYRLAQVKARR